MTVIENLHPRIQYEYTLDPEKLEEQGRSNPQEFPISFPYREREYVRCLINEQELTYNIHYQIPAMDTESLDTNELVLVLLITPTEDLDDDITVAEGDTITIYRATTIDQQAEFPQNAKFSSQKVTEALDKIVMILQEIDDTVGCCIKLPKEIALNFNTILPLPEAYKTLRWNEDATALENELIRGIVRIEKTDTEGLIDTYTIYFNDDTSMTYQVINGEKGDKGDQGEQGEQGPDGAYVTDVSPISQVGYDVTYRMTFSNGHTYDFTVTNGTGTLKWHSILSTDWIQDTITGLYKYSFNSAYSVAGVYKGSILSRSLIENIDITVESGITTIYSMEAFNGYVLMARTVDEEINAQYIHNQVTASDTWNINHNLGVYPTVDITDSSGSVVGGEVKYIDEDNIQIKFNIPFNGNAILNYTR